MSGHGKVLGLQFAGSRAYDRHGSIIPAVASLQTGSTETGRQRKSGSRAEVSQHLSRDHTASTFKHLEHLLGWYTRMMECQSACLVRAGAMGHEVMASWASEGSVPMVDAASLPEVVTEYGARPNSIASAVREARRLDLAFQLEFGQTWTLYLSRSLDRPKFAEREVEYARQLFEPFGSLISTWSQLQDIRQRDAMFQNILNAMECGVVLVDAQSRVVFSNSTADTILDAGDGLARGHGRISAVNFHAASMLQAAVNYVLQDGVSEASKFGESAPFFPVTRSRSVPLAVAVLAIGCKTDLDSGPLAAIYIVDPMTDLSGAILAACQLYGLSKTEARLATLIATGMSLNEAAQKIRIREQTARAYLRHIFSKVNVGRQAELVRVLLASIMRVHVKLVSI